MLAQPNHRRHHHSATPNSLDYNIWAEMLIKSNRNSFGRPDTDPNLGPWARSPLPPTNTRAHTIERYRQEMMELVRNMPEGEEEEVAAYELSLRDIVESPAAKKAEEDKAEDGKEIMKRKERRGENKGAAGLIMKAFFPTVRAALGGRKRIAGGGGGKGAKVSPKPDYEERSSSNGSGDGSGRRNRGGMGSCYLFLHKDRSKSMEI